MRSSLRSEAAWPTVALQRVGGRIVASAISMRMRFAAPIAVGHRSTTTPSGASPPKAGVRLSSVINRRHGRVLEVGVGTGLSLPAYDEQLEIVGIDLSPEMLDKARERVASEGLDNVTGLHEMDAGDLTFPDASFDTVVAMYVMTVVPDPEKVMRELSRVTKPGGEVILVNHFSAGRGRARLGGAPHGAVRRQARLAPGVRHRSRPGLRGPPRCRAALAEADGPFHDDALPQAGRADGRRRRVAVPAAS